MKGRRRRSKADGDAVPEGMIAQMVKTTAQAEQAIDKAVAFVEESNQRIAGMRGLMKGMNTNFDREDDRL